jgi:hypothetical protein
MKNFRFLFYAFLFLLAPSLIYSDPNGYDWLNFEGGGNFVEVIVAKNTTGNIANQILYARTDIGGVYWSNDNGLSWHEIICFGRQPSPPGRSSRSELIIAGMTVNPENAYNLTVCWGQDSTDCEEPVNLFNNPQYHCLWTNPDVRTKGTWVRSNINAADNERPWFKGDDFDRKIGGSCIIYDPRSGQSNRMFMGGISKSTNSSPRLYMSGDNGTNWNIVASIGTSEEYIQCIYMHPGSNQIWVGTGRRYGSNINGEGAVYRAYLDGNGVPGTFTKFSERMPSVRRILFRSDGSDVTAFVAYGKGEDGVTGGGIKRYMNGSWQNLTSSFGSENQTSGNYFCLLNWADAAETILLAGRWDRPIKKLVYNTTSWQSEPNVPNHTAPGILFIYNQSASDYPNHQFEDERTSYIYTGIYQIVRNPNAGLSQHWYITGGAGVRKSANVIPSGGNIFYNSTWQYTVYGSMMTVVNDVSWQTYNNTRYTFFPLADWATAWSTNGGLGFSEMNYDNRQTRVNGTLGPSYIPVVSRLLSNPQFTELTYGVGGDQFGSVNAAMYERNLSNNIYTRKTGGNHGIFTTSNRFVSDAIIYHTPGNANRILLLVGKSYGKSRPNEAYMGVYYSDNGGNSFLPTTFTDEPLDNPILSTQDAFDNSLIPALYEGDAPPPDGSIGGLYDAQTNFANIPNSAKVYLYLESVPGVAGSGGLFYSSDNGQNWTSMNGSTPGGSYKNEGCLKYRAGNLYLAMKNNGVYKGTINQTTGTVSWTAGLWGFSGATQIDVAEGNPNKIVVFGKRGNEYLQRTYFSINGGTDWTPLYYFTIGIRSIKIDPLQNSKVWLATSGQGVVTFDRLGTADNPEPWIVSENTTVNYHVYHDRDIIVQNGATLTLDGSGGTVLFDMGPNRKIEVQAGSRIIANNVTFSGPMGNWQGIYITNHSSTITFTNCTFSNAENPINIYNNEQTAYYNCNISGNTFNVPGSGTGVTARNVFNFTFHNNTVYMSSSSGKGVLLQNYYNAELPDGPNVGELYNIHITNNNFTGGYLQCFLGSYAMYLTPAYVYNNTFTNNSGGWCLVERMMTDVVKQNSFTTNSPSAAVGLWQSTPKMYGNTINNSNINSININSSYPLMGPSRVNNQFIWYGGRNNLSAGKDNIVMQSTGYPILEYGQNSLTISNSANYHVYGILPDTSSAFYCRNNCWNGNNSLPKTHLWNSWNNNIPLIYQNIGYSCNEQGSDQVSEIIDKGNGYYDTVYSSADNTGIPPSGDETAYAQANEFYNNVNYLEAIGQYKSLINSYPLSIYTYNSVSEMFRCYEMLDTSNSQSFKDNLYGDCKTYLENKIQNDYSGDQQFIDVAYNYILICEARMDNLGGAASGYELISLYHPDPTTRLMASWDYGEIQSILNGLGGGVSSNESETTTKIVEKINAYMDRNPTAKKVKEAFDKTITKNSSKNAVSDVVISELSVKAIKNISQMRSMNKEQRQKEIMNDWELILGKPGQTDDKTGNEIPLKFALYQNYPNPFNPVTTIKYDMPMDASVSIRIYDLLGREVANLVKNEMKKSGTHQVEWNAGNFASGVYFYRIEAGNFVQSKKMILVK